MRNRELKKKGTSPGETKSCAGRSQFFLFLILAKDDTNFAKKHEEQTTKANRILCCYYTGTNIDFIHYFTDEGETSVDLNKENV